MSDSARERIAARVRSACRSGGWQIPDAAVPEPPALDVSARIDRLKRCMEAVRAEVHVVAAGEWVPLLKDLVKKKGIKSLTFGKGTGVDKELSAAWPTGEADAPRLVPYETPVETFKSELFEMDAGITTTWGGIAETGAIILWPDEKEPRLLSLVPPVHFALLDSAAIYTTFAEAMAEGNWSDRMPSNVLLISGPSKTADIELVLTYGVHGPRELVVIVRR